MVVGKTGVVVRKLAVGLSCASIVAMTGFLSLFLGVCVSAIPVAIEHRTLIVTLVCFLAFVPAGFALLRMLLGKNLKELRPLPVFLAACFLGGLLYDRVMVPEGFKQIGLAALLLGAGLFSARMVSGSNK